jgi:hypothetical protein
MIPMKESKNRLQRREENRKERSCILTQTEPSTRSRLGRHGGTAPYVDNPERDSEEFQKKFCRRFHLPHAKFVELSQSLEESECFSRWKDGKKDACIPLLLLCALCYLGRGWTFDDLAENAASSEDVIRVFCHDPTRAYGSYLQRSCKVSAPRAVERATRVISTTFSKPCKSSETIRDDRLCRSHR